MSRDFPNNSIRIRFNGRGRALNVWPSLQQLPEIQNDYAAGVFALVVAIVNCVAGKPCALNRLHEEPVVGRKKEYSGGSAGAHAVNHAELGLSCGGVRRVPDGPATHRRDEHASVFVQVSERDRHKALGRVILEQCLTALADGNLCDCRGSGRESKRFQNRTVVPMSSAVP